VRPIDVVEDVIFCVNIIINMLILGREVPADCMKRQASTFVSQNCYF
jgi:hypothetical protein